MPEFLVEDSCETVFSWRATSFDVKIRVLNLVCSDGFREKGIHWFRDSGLETIKQRFQIRGKCRTLLDWVSI